MPKVIGIDLGTTFSAVAHIDDNGKPVILPNNQGAPITPSVIYIGSNDSVLVGEEAKEMQALGEADVAFLFKRNMGDPNFILNLRGRDYTPTQLSTLLLKQLKQDAENALGQPVDKAVITVPAYFDNGQRQATIDAGKAAGLEVLRIINEPTAAALAYGIREGNSNRRLLVYDLGGGTFDVTIVRVGHHIEVIATGGDHQLGGRDWDDRIAGYIASCFEEEFSINPLEEAESASDLVVRCEIAKKQLSSRERARISIAHDGEKGTYELPREKFEELTRDLMERTTSLVSQTLEEVSLTWEDMDGILLVGGSTRMPAVHRFVEEAAGKKCESGINVDEAVALGAAIQASLDSQTGSKLTLAAPVKVTDVMSHSLGVVAVNGDGSLYINSIIIPKNLPIPSKESHPFKLRTTPNQDNQLEVYMLQGESDKPSSCSILGRYVFDSINHGNNGLAIIDIEYAYDRNGVVSVNAIEKSTGNRLTPDIQPLPDDMSWLDRPPEDEKEALVHLNVGIAVDLSGSMGGEPLRQACNAARGFLSKLDLSHTSMGLIGFANKAEITSHLSQNAKELNKGIENLDAVYNCGSLGRGTLGQPFEEAANLFKDCKGPRFLIVLTDGIWGYRDKAVSLAQQRHSEGIEIIALGFGTADKNFLRQIATSDESALFTNLNQLDESFSRIAQVLTSNTGTITSSRGLTFFN